MNDLDGYKKLDFHRIEDILCHASYHLTTHQCVSEFLLSQITVFLGISHLNFPREDWLGSSAHSVFSVLLSLKTGHFRGPWSDDCWSN